MNPVNKALWYIESHFAREIMLDDQFGVTPEMIRARGHLDDIEFVEPINFNPPRIEQGRALLIAGVGERYGCEASAGIPSQWQRFLPISPGDL